MIGFFIGQRVKIKHDNGRDGIVGFLGTVKGITQAGLIVVLDSDPARSHRMYMPTSFEKARPHIEIRRFFYPYALESV